MGRLAVSLLAVSCLSMAGCALFFGAKDVRQQLDPYLGQHYDEALKTLGPPTSCAKLSTGGVVCEWDLSYVEYQQGTGGTVNRRFRLVVNEGGTIAEWRWQGPLRLKYRYLSSVDADRD